ncbi:MAG: thiamine diphosphokinase [Holosporales bacterium]|nr:thiamine diphosphokinase [Holosporales bacterium]
MIKLLDPALYRSVICLHGTLPNAEFFRNVGLPIIAADGAANVLRDIGVTPDIVIGDLDSVDPEIIEHIPHIRIPSQELSDFQKALRYAEQHSIVPSIICGVNGGCLDHIINNINIFMSSDSVMLDGSIVGFALSGRKELALEPETKISIFGVPKCTVSSRGLRWELDHHTLQFPGFTSCYNRTVADVVVIDVHEGRALVIIYTDDVQDAGSNGYVP